MSLDESEVRQIKKASLLSGENSQSGVYIDEEAISAKPERLKSLGRYYNSVLRDKVNPGVKTGCH